MFWSGTNEIFCANSHENFNEKCIVSMLFVCALNETKRKKERFVCIKKDTIKTIVIFKKDRSYLKWQNMLQNRMIYQWGHCLVNKCFVCVSQFFFACKYNYFNRKHWWCILFCNAFIFSTCGCSNVAYKNQQETKRWWLELLRTQRFHRCHNGNTEIH